MKEPQLNPQVADLAPTGPELTVYDEEHWREVCRIVLRIDPDTRGRPGATSIRKPPLACQMLTEQGIAICCETATPDHRDACL
jgi:hypothetical protein